MVTPTKIFISYARKDGRTLALRLQKSLSDLGYEVWLDTSEIDGGDDWGGRIESSIDGCHILLALMSPASYTSEICRAEQLRAIRKEKRVIPALVMPCDRPIWLEHRNYRDFSNLSAYDMVLSQLHDDLKNMDGYIVPTLAPIYNNAPALPPHFIQRPNEYIQLKNALLSDTTDRQVALTALQGLGGIGKSVIANAVCKDEFLAGAFPDGVFWVEIGREPSEIVTKLKTIGVQLGDNPSNYITLNDATSSFRNIITHKSALIVLDDVWDESYKVANYFIGTSPRTRWLVTTRNQSVVDEIGATPVQLGMMQPDQALQLMREWAGREDDQFPTIAKRLGYHPLAVKIVGSRLKGMKSADWLKSYDITRVKMGLSAHNRDDNLVACFEVSVNSLPQELPPLYHALGIFPEDKWIPESMVMRLWQAQNADLTEFDCTEILTELAKLALINRQTDTAEIRMHDLLHDYNRFKIKADYANLQTTFIAALGDKYVLPHDYAWRFYAYHLLEAGQGNVLRGLLIDYAWLDKKLRATDTSALLNDCDVWLSRGKDEPIRLIRSAISMSAHVLDKDKNALAHQLAGRLMHHYREVDEIRIFLDVVMKTPNNLFPAFPDSEYDILNPAGGMLLCTMKYDDSVGGAIQLDGGHILSWAGSDFRSQDNTLRLWDADGTPLATLTGHRDNVNGATQLADGRILSWSNDKILRVWDADGNPLATLTGHTDDVHGATQLRDGRILSWSADNTLRLWDADGKAVAILTGHTSYVRGATQLRDGRILSWAGNPYSESKDKTLHLWDADGSPFATMTGHMAGVTGATQLADGLILSWSWDNTLCLWDANGTPLATLTGHTAGVLGATQLRDGRILSWSADNTLRLWDADGKAVATLTGHTSYVRGATQLRDGRILSWSKDNTLRLWDADGTPLATLTGHTSYVRGATQLRDGRILSWSADKTLRLWDADGNPLATLTGHTSYVRGATQLADGRILSWSRDKTLRLWNADGTPIATLTGHTSGVTGATQLADGRILSWSEDDATLRLWDADGTPIATLMGHTGWVTGATQLHDGRLLSWSWGYTLRLWDADGNAIDVLEQDYDDGDRQIIGTWAEKHGYTLDDFYPPENDKALFMAGGRVKWYKNYSGDMMDLIITDPQTGEMVYTFYGDAPFEMNPVVLAGSRVLVAGDSAGRVLFLRWVGEDGA